MREKDVCNSFKVQIAEIRTYCSSLFSVLKTNFAFGEMPLDWYSLEPNFSTNWSSFFLWKLDRATKFGNPWEKKVIFSHVSIHVVVEIIKSSKFTAKKNHVWNLNDVLQAFILWSNGTMIITMLSNGNVRTQNKAKFISVNI